MMEPIREKMTEPGKQVVNDGCVRVGTVKPVAMEGAELGKSATVCLRPNLLPAEEFSTESDADILSDRISEWLSERERWTDSDSEQKVEPLEEDVPSPDCAPSNMPEPSTSSPPVLFFASSPKEE